MKKILIIAALTLTTAVTAFALTTKESKPTTDKITIENTTGKAANMAFATAD